MINLPEGAEWADPEAVAIQGLGFIAADPIQLRRFLDLTGLDPSQLRSAASEPGFLAGLLDFLLGHEPTLLSFAAAAGLRPEDVQRARAQLARGYADVPR